jgi:MFS family permease
MRKLRYIKYIPARIRSFTRANPVAVRYGVDGLFIAAGFNLAANNNNLYATRLGAGDFQLSLVQFLPQIFTLLILLPGGFFIDSLYNKKRMVMTMISISAMGYVFCAFAPVSPFDSVYFFLAFLAVAAGAMALFNISWQSFFPDVVDIHARNRVLTVRTQVSIFIAMLVPLISGGVLTRIPSADGKIIAHQIFYLAAAAMLLSAAFHFRRFEAVRPAAPRRISLEQIKKAGRSLLGNKGFLFFLAVTMFFYFTWMMDWTLYFIGQVRYLHMNELQLSLAVVGGTAAQLLTIRFWSKKNEKYGVVLPVTFGILGLSLCPLAMIGAVSLPSAIAPYAFIIFHTLACLAFATVTLNMFQCQLQVLDENYRSFYLSVFSCLTCFSNAIMPVAGVALYRFMGADINGLRITLLIVFSLRILAAGLWFMRYKRVSSQSVP